MFYAKKQVGSHKICDKIIGIVPSLIVKVLISELMSSTLGGSRVGSCKILDEIGRVLCNSFVQFDVQQWHSFK